MAEPLDLITQAYREAEQEKAQSEIIRAQDADKEKARKAMIMADGDQDAATYAYGNYDLAYKAYKGRLDTHIVDNDPMLQTYFNTNPMAALISKDDLSNLNDYNKAMGPFRGIFNNSDAKGAGSLFDAIDEDSMGAISTGVREFIHALPATFAGAAGMGAGASIGAGVGTAFPVVGTAIGGLAGALIGGLVAGFAASYAEEEAIEKLWPEEAERRKKGLEEHPYAGIVGSVLSAAPAFGIGGLSRKALLASIPARAGGGAIMAGIEGAQELVTKGELDPAALTAWFVGGAIFAGNPHWYGAKAVESGEALAGRVFGTGRFITEHIRQGELPPKGVNPIWDYLLAKDSEASMQLYDEAFKAAQNAETRESSPTLMGNLSEQHTKGDIGLKWDGVKKLYGENLPEPGDGLLGDVPGFVEQFNSSIKSGEDISVPWKHWINVEKEVEKALHDDIRLPNRWTINEAKEVKDPGEITDWSPVFESKPEQTINDTRKATGLGVPVVKVTPEAQAIVGQIAELEKQHAETVKRFGPDSVEAGAVADQIARIKDEAGIVPGAAPTEETVLFKPGVLLPKRQYERMVRDIKKIQEADEAKKLQVEQRKAARRLTPAWNKEAANMHAEVSAEIDKKPEWIAWKFMTTGEIRGEKLAPARISRESVTPEQLKDLPDSWLSNEPTALDIDLVARLSGFRTGDDFVSHMKSFKEVKGREAFGQFRAKAIQSEIERRMESKYGRFEDLTAAEARQYVISPEAEDMLWHEYPILAEIAGQKIPFDREAVYQMALADFGERPWRKQSVKKIADELGRSARKTHDAWQADDKLGAFQARQEVVHKVALARIAKEFEARTRADKRIVKQLSQTEPTNMDPEYASWAHQIMIDHEIPVKREQDNLDRYRDRPEIEHKTFADFVNDKNYPIDPENPGAVGLPLGYDDFRTAYATGMPIDVDLLKPGGLGKILDEMTVREYKTVTNALRVLKKLGQDKSEGIVTIRGEKLKVDDLRPRLISMLAGFGTVKQPRPGRELKARQAFRTSMIKLQGTEAWIDRLARYGDDSAWHEFVYYPVSQADHEHTRLRTEELGPRLRETFKGVDAKWLNKRVDPGPLMIPGTNQAMDTSNETVVSFILNWASDDMRAHTAGGYKIEVADGQAWLDLVATQEHYDIARRIAKLYDWAQGLEDNMTMERTGSIMERDPLGRIIEPNKGDQIGWYYPRKRDTRYSKAPEHIDPRARNTKVAIRSGWHEERTGQVYPVQLHLSGLADDLERRMKFIAIQPILDIWNKVLNHSSVLNEIQAHFGEERVISLKQWFNDLAGVQGTRNDFDLRVTGWFNSLSTKMITDYIGFNIKTFFKHAPQSFYQSAKEMGWAETYKAAARARSNSPSITENSNHDFIWNGGIIGGRKWNGIGELKIRQRSFDKEPSRVMDEILGKTYGIAGDVVHGMSRWGAAPIATVDTLMSEVTGMAKYNQTYPKELARLTEGKALTAEQWMEAEWKAHQRSVDLAAKSIRMTHGSTSISGKPELLRSQNPVVQANVKAMTFFNNALQRRIRSVNMFVDMIQGKSPRPVTQDIRTISRDFFTYVVMPTIIEDAVEPICGEDDEALVCTGKMVMQGAAAPIPIVRDIVHSILTGTPITGGIGYGLINFGTKMVKEADKAFIEGDDTRVGDFVENFMGFTGGLVGYPGAVLGREANYLIKLFQDEERLPDTIAELWNVLAKGKTEPSKHESEHKRLIQRLVE